ncbi:MAG: hypothetical protein EBT52_08600, partial [Flavobacteriia bacterium]|nr:hypothetical protein [Flavobacteriia bacterium]
MTEIILTGIAAVMAGAAGTWLFLRGQYTGLEVQASDLKEARDRALDELSHLREEQTSLRAALSAERAGRAQEVKNWAEKQEVLVKAQEDLVKQFDALSRKALDMNSKSFLELARTQMEKMITEVDQKESQRKLELEKLVEPLSKSLEKVNTHVREVEKEREKAYASITEQVKGLTDAQMAIR